MKRVLFLAFYFPPRNNVACYRSGCFAKFLPQYGWLPTVVCQDWPADRPDSDPDFVGAFPDSVEIHRIPAPAESGLYERVLLRKLAPYFWPHRAPILWWRQARHRVESLLQSTQFDAIWATSDPLTPLTLAMDASHSTGIPWTADIRDCLNVQRFGSWYKRPFFRRQERRLCRQANGVITVSDGLAQALARITGKPVSVIPNGFDSSLLPNARLEPMPVFTILYAGTLVVGRQDPRPVLQALQLCIERGSIPRGELEMLFLGSKPESVKQVLEATAGTLPVRVLPRLPHREALDLQTRASVLLLLAHAAEQGIMTAKVFDYLAANRPILAVPDDRHTTSKLLKATGGGVALSDVESIARQLTEWYTRWRSDRAFNLQRNETEIARYSRSAQAGELAQILDKLSFGKRVKAKRIGAGSSLLRASVLAGLLVSTSAFAGQIELWLTSPEESARFERQATCLGFGETEGIQTTIEVDENKTYQTMDGFGFCLTGGSATHLMRMSQAARSALLKELFSTEGNGIGASYLRVSIGASDLDDHVFSYDDLPPGEIDPELARFSLEPDRATLIPALKQILEVNPDLKILGSPWSPPTWMKTNHDSRGGSLDPRFYGAYAKYFVKYIQGMKAQGIRLDAITVQNEPLHPGNNPSMLMLAPEQAQFIKHYLGPALRAAGLSTKIILYDHNADRPDYPISILNDPEARNYVDGSAFHLYRGPIEALSKVHEAYPDKNLYFTEQWVGAPGNLRADLDWHVKTLIVGATRNWSRIVLEWNLSSNPELKPHTDRGGCSQCLGAVTIDGDKVVRNPAYYIIAHASKFVRPGSVRIGSSDLQLLPNAAFKTPAGNKVLIVVNSEEASQSFDIYWCGQYCRATLKGGAVGTYIW